MRDTGGPSFAERLCRQEGLDAGEVFSQQWHLSRVAPSPVASFEQCRLGEWVLSYGRSLPMATAQKGEVCVALLGHGVDADGILITEDVLQGKLGQLQSFDAWSDYLGGCAGRYLYIIAIGGETRLYLDPVGTMGAVWNTVTDSVAATMNLCISHKVSRNDGYAYNLAASKGQGGRYAFGHTGDAHVKRLLPNHYLNLETRQMIRDWPYGDAPFECAHSPEAYHALIDQIIARHAQVMGAMAEGLSPAILPISGGEDSRALLACAKPHFDKFDLFFCHAENFRGRQDIEVARKLAEAAKVDLFVIDPSKEAKYQITDADQLRRHQAAYRIGIGQYRRAAPARKSLFQVKMGLPEGGVVMRGHVTDILKAVLWRNLGLKEFGSGAPHSDRMGVRMLMLGDEAAEMDPAMHGAYRAWFNSLPPNAQARPYDFMGIEQFRPHGMGAEFYAFTRNFYVTPGNDRQIIRAACSLPPVERGAFHFNDMLLERAAPELLNFDYTRELDNVARRSRAPLFAV